MRSSRWLLLGGSPVVAAGPWLGDAGQQIAYALLAAVAAAAVVAGVRLYRPARTRPWWLLAAAMLCGAVSSACWAAGFLLGSPPADRSVINIIYFAMYVLTAGAVAGMAGGTGRGSALAGMTEAGVAACTATVLAWVFLIDPFVDDRSTWAGGAVLLGYPLLDLFVLAVAVRLAATAGPLTRAHVLVMLAALSLVAADVIYFLSVVTGGTWSGPGVSVVGWMLFYLLLGAAALHPRMAAEVGGRRSAGRRATGLYLIVVLVGPAVTAYAFLRHVRDDELDVLDVVLPLGATALIAVLLVIRLSHAGVLVDRRATELQAALDEQAALQRQMSHLALHDVLTGLPNRLSLERAISAALAGSAPGCLLMLDLDGFQHVNDSFGHPVGDALLSTVAARLCESVGESAVPARLGGDEFAVLLTDADEATIAARCEAVLATLRRPVQVLDHRLYVTASIGVRLLDPAAGRAEMLSDADLALHAAKAAGKDRAVTYDAGLREQQLRRIAVVERLRDALGTDEISVHYQPIVSLRTGAFDAVEALVRWHPPGAAPIGPDSFIPAAEDSGLIVALGDWVLRRACRDAAGWHRRYGTRLTVNVSPRQLREPDFAARVRRALDESGLPAAALILEITEGVLVSTGEHAGRSIAHLSELRAAGVGVAVDDFGTGYSSLAYLRDLPIDLLKIDKSFLPAGDADADGHRVALMRTIIDLAHDLGLATVAEGVETSGQAALLITLGCDKGQGYLYARPAPAAETDRVLAGAAPLLDQDRRIASAAP